MQKPAPESAGSKGIVISSRASALETALLVYFTS